MSIVAKKHRLGRLINKKTGRIFVAALDHGLQHGPHLKGIGRLRETLSKIMEGEPDAVILNPGNVKSLFSDYAGNVGLIVKLTAFTPFNPHFDAPIGSVEEAVKLGADAVSVGFLFGNRSDVQVNLLNNTGFFVEACLEWGIPLFVHAYPRGEEIPKEEWYNADRVAYAARAAAELGADYVKTSYTGDLESFRKVVETCPVPVIQAGGPKVESDLKFLRMVENAIKAGAIGVAVGRNLFSHERPDAMAKAIRMVVHEDLSAEEAAKTVL
ncbi:fructose-bisphosphate aldolase [Candidatus Bathyarchaeota archaeon]|nr:fructose-bisphosphate aldolase [Candidatus Bathyarchaeota archaeon]